jgi:hypothetical protein
MPIIRDSERRTYASNLPDKDLPKFWRVVTNRGCRTSMLLLILTTMGAGAAWADFPGDVPDRFKFQVGGVDANFTTQASLTLSDGPAGAFIDFEEVFDLPLYQKDWFATGFYRFSDKGYIDFGYVDFERSAHTIIDQDVQWGEFTLLANADVQVDFGTAFYYAAYRHDFLQLEQVHISLSAGFAYLDLTAGLAASGNVEDQNGNAVSGEVERRADVAFPVPLLGLQLDWKLTKHTAIQMYTRLLYIDYQDFAGGIRESAINYEWYFTRHFGIGGGYSSYQVNIKRYDTGDYTARFDYDVQGLDLYLKMAF